MIIFEKRETFYSFNIENVKIPLEKKLDQGGHMFKHGGLML